MIILQNFLRELTFVQIADIKRHANGLLKALEKSNRKEMLEYQVKSEKNDNRIKKIVLSDDKKWVNIHFEDNSEIIGPIN